MSKAKTLVSIFDTLNVPHFPAAIPHLGIFVSLINLCGDVSVLIAIKSSNGETLMNFTGEARQIQPEATVDFAINVAGLVLENPGKYWLEVSLGTHLLSRRPVNVNRMQLTQPPPVQGKR